MRIKITHPPAASRLTHTPFSMIQIHTQTHILTKCHSFLRQHIYKTPQTQHNITSQQALHIVSVAHTHLPTLSIHFTLTLTLSNFHRTIHIPFKLAWRERAIVFPSIIYLNLPTPGLCNPKRCFIPRSSRHKIRQRLPGLKHMPLTLTFVQFSVLLPGFHTFCVSFLAP